MTSFVAEIWRLFGDLCSSLMEECGERDDRPEVITGVIEAITLANLRVTANAHTNPNILSRRRCEFCRSLERSVRCSFQTMQGRQAAEHARRMVGDRTLSFLPCVVHRDMALTSSSKA